MSPEDRKLLLRHAREYAALIGTPSHLAERASPIDGKGRNMTLPAQRRHRIPKAVEARAAAIRIGLGMGLRPRDIAFVFCCSFAEVLRPRPIPLSDQKDRIARTRNNWGLRGYGR